MTDRTTHHHARNPAHPDVRDYTCIPKPGSGGELYRVAMSSGGTCDRCEGLELVAFTFARSSGWLCPSCDDEHAGELEKLGARHCSSCDHTEHEHSDPRFGPRCAVLSCPCAGFERSP